jgi:hypothetical protein
MAGPLKTHAGPTPSLLTGFAAEAWRTMPKGCYKLGAANVSEAMSTCETKGIAEQVNANAHLGTPAQVMGNV